MIITLAKSISFQDHFRLGAVRVFRLTAPRTIILALSLTPSFALTTVADTITGPDGVGVSGTIYITANSQFTGTGGTPVVYQVPIAVQIASDGTFSVSLVPNDTASPAGTSYAVRYTLDGPPGTSLQSPQETWVVPTSGSPVTLATVRTSPAPTPSVSGYITSLNSLTAVTQLFARVNDTNVTLAINSATSTHTFTMGWTGTLAASRGGTGLNTSASTGVPKITAGTWSADATAQDLTSWPAGVSNTEVGYLDGVTSAIQTQLDGKASTGSLASYLPLTGGTLTGALTVQKASADDFGWPITVQKRGTTGDATSAVKSGAELGYWSFDGWNGSAYQRGGLAIMYASEDWSGSQAGTKMQFYTTHTGTTSNALNAQFDENGNWVVGSIGSSSTYRLDIQESGSGGTMRVYDQSVSGITREIVRAGAAQSTNNLTEWHSSAGSMKAAITPDGRVVVDNTTPSASTDACAAQSIWVDANYVYVCVSSGAIKRAPISAF